LWKSKFVSKKEYLEVRAERKQVVRARDPEGGEGKRGKVLIGEVQGKKKGSRLLLPPTPQKLPTKKGRERQLLSQPGENKPTGRGGGPLLDVSPRKKEEGVTKQSQKEGKIHPTSLYQSKEKEATKIRHMAESAKYKQQDQHKGKRNLRVVPEKKKNPTTCLRRGEASRSIRAREEGKENGETKKEKKTPHNPKVAMERIA